VISFNDVWLVFSHINSNNVYSQTFYVKENGIDLSITNAIEAIVSCLRSEEQYCVNVPDEGVSLKSLGM
jgi:hypothetical protein